MGPEEPYEALGLAVCLVQFQTRVLTETSEKNPRLPDEKKTLLSLGPELLGIPVSRS